VTTAPRNRLDLSVREVEVPCRKLAMLEPLIGRDRYHDLTAAADRACHAMENRTVWNLSSTATGGGVAEMLQVLVGYTIDVDVDVRWLVMAGDPEFFATTKRIHNRLHGAEGDSGELGAGESAHYAAVSEANAASALERIRPGDIVLLHDPQTAGMAPHLLEAGAKVVWRCHVGREDGNKWTEQAWGFLAPHLGGCDAYIFSLESYVPTFVDPLRVQVIPPSIDPFSPKNQELEPGDVARILSTIGLVDGAAAPGDGRATFQRRDGSAGTVSRRASIVAEDGTALPAGSPLVVQVSRWDRLKDMAGVMHGFAMGAQQENAHLALVGPATGDVSDDPEGNEVYRECVTAWQDLPAAARRRVRLVTLPMDDVDENAAMVNAIQRHATVITQKSLAEGFGLTVAEGMWKAAAVVASEVGGITAQIAPGTGVLLADPLDLRAFGDVVSDLIDDPVRARELGQNAREHVLDNFVGDRHLIRYADLLERLSDS
jgi:trehalose synthase